MPSSFNAVKSFLSDPGVYRDGTLGVEIVQTHGAMVFLGRHDVYKIKKPVAFSYMDFSTLERRRAACVREIELNQPFAPDIYLGVCAITQEDDGGLAFDGAGPAVEYAVHMKRFPDAAILRAVAESRGLTGEISRALGKRLAGYHHMQKPLHSGDGIGTLEEVANRLCRDLGGLAPFPPAGIVAFSGGCREWGGKLEETLRLRADAGFVRRCHGDLHLENIVLLKGSPVFFDALEFDEKMASIDVLYDLAFLLMDMLHRGLAEQANAVFNGYACEASEFIANNGLRALPFLLGLRAGVRAMVNAQTAACGYHRDNSAYEREAREYLVEAVAFMQPEPPLLVAVGGFSGTGKSTLAARLAPALGKAPGALILRSDVERKKLFNIDEYTPLPEEAYRAAISGEVYRVLGEKARCALAGGHAVVLDAVHARKEELAAAAEIARSLGVPFSGLWLDAPDGVLMGRVAARGNDASDADPGVLKRQLERHRDGASCLSDGWRRLDASGGPQQTAKAAARFIVR